MPRAAVGAAAGAEGVDRLLDRRLLRDPGRLQGHLRLAGIGDDSHRIGRLQLVEQQAQAALHQGELVVGLHRPADIDQEHQVGPRPLPPVAFPGLEADPDQPVLRIPGTVRHLHMGRERFVPAGRGIVVGEVVHQLLQPDRVPGRQRSFAEEATGVRVAGRVGVHAEGRERCRGHVLVGILGNRSIGFGSRRTSRRRKVAVAIRQGGRLLGPTLQILFPEPLKGTQRQSRIRSRVRCGRRQGHLLPQGFGFGPAPGARGVPFLEPIPRHLLF